MQPASGASLSQADAVGADRAFLYRLLRVLCLADLVTGPSGATSRRASAAAGRRSPAVPG